MIYKMSIEEMVEYAKKRIAGGAEIIAAKKGTPVLFEKAPVGFTFNTFVSNGRTEAEKVTIEEGDMIATALNPDESVKIMENGEKNQWKVTAENRKKLYGIDENYEGIVYPLGVTQYFIRADKAMTFDAGWGEQSCVVGDYLKVTSIVQNEAKQKVTSVDEKLFGETYVLDGLSKENQERE